MAKIRPVTKTKITKLFKQGKSLAEIKQAVSPEFPKITLTRIRVVIRKHLIGLCDELWSKAVKIRDGGKCVISGKSTGLNSHHMIGRGNYKFRWVLDNGVTLAADHHTLGNDIAPHGPTDVTERFAKWMIEHKGLQWVWMLENMDDKKPAEIDIFSLKETAVHLQAEIEQRAPDILQRKKL